MATKRNVVIPKRGEIWLVDFDPTVGAEIKKTRPALIIQNDIANRHSPITIVAAITSYINDRIYPTEVIIYVKETGLKKDSVVLLNQIRSIDKQRLVERVGILTENTMAMVDRALEISLGMATL